MLDEQWSVLENQWYVFGEQWSVLDNQWYVFAYMPSSCPDPDEEQEEGYSYEQATKGWEADDAVLLMRLYTAVVAASKAAMQHFAMEVGAGFWFDGQTLPRNTFRKGWLISYG